MANRPQHHCGVESVLGNPMQINGLQFFSTWHLLLYAYNVFKFAFNGSNLIGPLCFIKSKVNTPFYQYVLEHFMIPSAGKLYGEAIWFYSRTWHLPTMPKVQIPGLMTIGLLCLMGQQTPLIWTPLKIYGVLSRGWRETQDPTMQTSLSPLSKQPGLPLQKIFTGHVI